MSQNPDSAYVKKTSINGADLWKKLNQKLTHLDIELTERCNNKCIHCYINLPEHDHQAQKKELTTDEIKDVLVQAADLGCMSVRFTGGEPMLRHDFDELYLFAKKLGMKIIIFTNATLVDQQKIELFEKFPPGAPIEVSVYGMTKETYEGVSRAPGSFEAAFHGMQLLLDNNIPFVVKSSFLPQNKKDMELFEEWAKKIPGMTHDPTYSIYFDLRTHRDSASMNERIKKLRPSPAEGLKLLTRDEESFFKDSQQFCAKFTAPPGDKVFACGAGNKSASIDAYGNVQVCLLVRHPETIYSLRHGTLEDAIDSFFPKVLATRSKNPDYLQKCAKCFLKGMCQQCPGRSWGEFGTLDTPVPYFCEVTHAQARWLGLLAEDEHAWEVEDWQARLDEFINKKFEQK